MLFSSRELMYLLPVQFTYDFKIFTFKKREKIVKTKKKATHKIGAFSIKQVKNNIYLLIRFVFLLLGYFYANT